MKIAVFPGSYDPFTIGHEAVVSQALSMFDKIVIAVGTNSTKSYLYDVETRVKFVKSVYQNISKIQVATYSGLTVDYCEKIGAQYILRGLRNASDFEFEKNIAHMNLELNNQIQTIFLLAPASLSSISATIVREIIKNNGDASKFVPASIEL